MNNIENLYELSPIQQGLLFHGLYAPGSGMYFNQLACVIRGMVNVPVFERSWQKIVDRHPILRTSFYWEDTEKPIQVVQKQAQIPMVGEDWRGLSSIEQEKQLTEFLERDRLLGVDITIPPLMRLALIRLADDAYQFVWSYHHLLMDGWSKSAIIREVVAVYEATCRSEEALLPQRRPYVDYIRWLQQQDISRAEAFWRKTLAGFTTPTDLRPDFPPGLEAQDGYSKRDANLDETTTTALQIVARQHQLTLNTIVQGAWALVLSRRGKSDDVLFGAVVSGRPPGLAGVESMIGLFINTLPVRVRLPGETPLLDALRSLQQQQVEMRQYEYSPLIEVHRCSEIPAGEDLFNSILTFENYPVEPSNGNDRAGIEVTGVRHISRNNYLLTTLVEPGVRLSIQLLYDRGRFEASTIDLILEELQTVLTNIAFHPQTTAPALKELLASNERSREEIKAGKQEESNFKRFKSVKPRAVSLSQVELIKTRRLNPDDTLPLVIEPNMGDLDLQDWCRENREFIEERLLKHGAILFRGFKVKSAAEFERVAQALCPCLFGEYGDLPREGLGGKVYGSTPYPPDQTILFHNESSHMHRWPLKIFFYCVTAPQQGGETLIVDCRKVYQLLDPGLKEYFLNKKLMYVRNFFDGVDVNWTEFFHTTEKSDAEEYCRKALIDFEWKDGGSLRTRKLCQAITQHPKTGEMTFFNQIQLHHVSCLDPAVAESLLSILGEDCLPRNVYYGDGMVIEDSVMRNIGQIYWKTAVRFPWLEGDILMLDNMLTAHARLPYVGPRKIVVAMGEMVERQSI